MAVPHGTSVRIRKVWGHNAVAEFNLIGKLKHKFSTVAIDSEFPGSFSTYRALKANVDMMKLIQVGITLIDNRGQLPVIDGAYCIWQFNLRNFDLRTDRYVKSSIELLRNSGIDFERNRRDGLASRTLEFDVCYQGDYDFAYLHKAVTGDQRLPSTLAEYAHSKAGMFGPIFDVRCVQLQYFQTMYGLQKFSDSLGVKPISGTSHQAGSDSLLTASTYEALKSTFSSNNNQHYSETIFGQLEVSLCHAEVFHPQASSSFHLLKKW
ncbi:hypothetical protein KP509_13G034300 [Ceratopteris richardii]|uniref:Uncharacterized protein n=1 Tax=Ceratopteris richardii TaxID=49495 RepID=A0A8T2TEL3_CERRI|nr:hypothetical protein KP509_13G034300 [Ceratopteris richardii]